MKVVDLLVLFLIICLIIFWSIFFWYNLIANSKTESYDSFAIGSSSRPVSFNSMQFYNNMRFASNKISYDAESACDSKKLADIYEAFSILSNRTLLNFYQTTKDPQINFLCSEITFEKLSGEQKSYYVAGEGGPTEAINLSNGYYLIEHGQVSIFGNEKCNKPNLALHEILHVLGFDHSSNPKSIMYPVTNCDETLDDSIVQEINQIYSVSSLSDLVIEKINANKTSSLLSFSINVANYGFIDAVNTTLDVISNGSTIFEHDLGTITPGTKKIFDIQNFKVQLKSNSLLFIVSSNNKSELSLDNNKVELSLVGTQR